MCGFIAAIEQKHMRNVRIACCALVVAVLSGCLEDLQAVGPGKSIATPAPITKAQPGTEGKVYAQVLDSNKLGVDGAHVVFTRTDATRLVWAGASDDTDAVSAVTASNSALGVNLSGLAEAAFRVPDDAPEGEAIVIAVLKEPADPNATIAVRLTVEVAAAEETGGAPNAGAGGGSGSAGTGAGGGSEAGSSGDAGNANGGTN